MLSEPGTIRLCYISPSVFPSRSANSIHVILQTHALAGIGVDVTVFGCRTVSDPSQLADAIRFHYGVDVGAVRFVTCFARTTRAATLRIAALTLFTLWKEGWPQVIICRNVYAAFLIGVIHRRPLLFEAHEVERGWRGLMQRAVVQSRVIRVVAISRRLADDLNRLLGAEPPIQNVLPDAAPKGIVPLEPARKRTILSRICPVASGPWSAICGYVGHLHPGRGIEVIEHMAAQRPDVLFVIAGGREEDVITRRAANTRRNVSFVGHLPHQDAMECARCVDVLLMPYQESVSVGVAGRDTVAWMSPMKMFEYMASGVPVISSDLPVLREVLRDGENAVLVPASDPAAWVTALNGLLDDGEFASRIGRTAHAEYAARHTWEHRARTLLRLAE